MKVVYINENSAPYSETFVGAEKQILQRHGVEVVDINLRELRFSLRGMLCSSICILRPRIWKGIFQIIVFSADNYRRLRSNGHAIMLFISNYQKVLALVAGSSHLRAHFLGKRAVFAFLMSQGTGIPFSAVAHAEDLFSWTSSVRIIIKHALLIHVISNYNIGYLNAKTSFRFSDKLQLIRNSFYRQERDQNQSLEVSGLSHARNVDVVDGVRPVRFFMASRLVANKGIIEWIEVLSEFKKLRMFEMMIAGDGPIKEQICQRIDELSLRREISLLGVIPSKAVHENIANCDFAVIFSMNASLTWPHMDGLPTFFFEALSAGVPVISTFVSGIPEIVLHGFNGILLSPNSSPRQNALILNRQIQNGKFDRCRIREHFYDYLNELEGGEVLYGCLSNMHTAAGDNSSGFSP